MVISRLKAYITLIKPTIMLLVVITGAAGLVADGGLTNQPLRFALALLLLTLAGGSANGLNQYLERDRDRKMKRTRRRRPLPMARINPTEALVFSVLIGVASVVGFAVIFNWLSAALAAATILFYALFYTLYLKPRTHLNIVIGGAAGAMAPVIAWAASTGGTGLVPWLMAAIIFFWTPPHFWSLALCLKDDYRRVNLPMLPLLVEDDETWRQMRSYTWLTLLLSLVLAVAGLGKLYAVAALVLGGIFLYFIFKGGRHPTLKAAWQLFSWSIIYLLVLFTVIIVDRALAFN